MFVVVDYYEVSRLVWLTNARISPVYMAFLSPNPTPFLIFSFYSCRFSFGLRVKIKFFTILECECSEFRRSLGPISSGLCLFQLGSHGRTAGSGLFLGYPGTLTTEWSNLPVTDRGGDMLSCCVLLGSVGRLT